MKGNLNFKLRMEFLEIVDKLIEKVLSSDKPTEIAQQQIDGASRKPKKKLIEQIG